MLIMKGKEIKQFSVYYGHKHERRLFLHIDSSKDIFPNLILFFTTVHTFYPGMSCIVIV